VGNPDSSSVFIPARPIIKIDNREESELIDGLLTLLVVETTAGLYRCEAAFGNWGSVGNEVGFLYLDRKLLDFGKTLSIEAGSDETAAQVFKGRIMGLEALYPAGRPPEILVLAEDTLQDLRMTRRSRSFEDISDSDVIQQIAAEYSMQTDLDIDGPTYRVLAQVNRSDLAFLRQRARAIDADLWLEDNTLYVHARSRREAGEVTLSYPYGLKEFSVCADLANQCTSLVVGGWDVSAKENIAYEAAESAIQDELTGGQSGAGLLQSTLGERVERLVHLTPANSSEAQYLAEAHFRAKARRFITGSGFTNGDGRIHAGTKLKLEGLGDMFNGKYYVTEVRHTFDGKNGYRTYFKVERPGL
jgi:phage protein D